MRRGFTNRRCPKCSGNVFVDEDDQVNPEEGYRGLYEWCMQCGYRHYLQPAVFVEELNVTPAMKELVGV